MENLKTLWQADGLRLEVTRLPFHYSLAETKTYIYVLGYCENPADQKWESQGVVNKAPAKALMEAFATEAQADAALDHLKEYWSQLLGKFHVESDYTEMNRMVNVWNQYQCMVTFNMSRSASYFESGIGRGMGFVIPARICLASSI